MKRTIKYNKTDKCEKCVPLQYCQPVTLFNKTFRFAVYLIPNASVTQMQSLWSAFACVCYLIDLRHKVSRATIGELSL